MNIQEAMRAYNRKEITEEEFKKIIETSDDSMFWDPKKERRYHKDDNRSCNSLPFDFLEHKKGRFLQSVIKRTIIKMVTFAHKSLLQRYDKDIFTYDDPRLKQIDDFAHLFIALNFTGNDYKKGFCKEAIDIGLGIAKVDVYWRARLLKGINELIKSHPNEFELTKEEKWNLEKWH